MKKIITLSTIPSRIKDVGEFGIMKTLHSLINQEYDGEFEIHFNVPIASHKTQEPYVIPEKIRDLAAQNSHFKIFDGLEDKGSVSKIFYTLQREQDPDSIIITSDDDLVYHPKMLEEQVKNQEKYPNTAVGYDGFRAERENGEQLFHDQRDHFVVSVPRDTYVSWLQNYKTVSYRRSFFGEDFYEFALTAPTWADDLIISSYLGMKKIPRLVTCYENEPKIETIEEWMLRGGVLTFPVLAHTAHERYEGCELYRKENVYDNHSYFVEKGYIK